MAARRSTTAERRGEARLSSAPQSKQTIERTHVPHPVAGALLPILVLTLVGGCNWPILKMGVEELAPLTFRALTLPIAAIGMLVVSRLSGDSIRIPRELWPRIAVLALFNIALWNGFVLFG